MKGNIILFTVAIFLIIIFAGTYFLFQTVTSDPNSMSHESELGARNGHENLGKGSNVGNANGNEGKANKNAGQSKVLGVNSNSSVNSLNQISKVGEVVDQKLIGSAITEENEKVINSNVLGSVKEKINVEFILLNGEENKDLANYAVEIKYKFNRGVSQTENLTTDATGKIVFSTTDSGFIGFQIFTKDFSIYTKNFMVRHGQNKYVAKLYKGGRIEVKATNVENKIVEGLTGRLGGAGWRGRQISDFIPLEFDATRGLYFLDNVPIGTQDISFKAPGFVESAAYKMVVDSKTIALLDIKLFPSRTIKIDLDVVTKPDAIYIVLNRVNQNNNRIQRNDILNQQFNSNVMDNATGVNDTSSMQTVQPGGGGARNNGNRNNNFRNRMVERRNANSTENEQLVVKNPDGLYYVELEDRNTSALTVITDKFAPKDVALVSDKDLYKITLIEGSMGELIVNDESGKPIEDASIKYYSGSFRQTAVTGTDGVAQLFGLKETMSLVINISCKNYVSQNQNWSFNSTDDNSKTIVLVAAKGLSGTIKFGDKVVMGSKVLLFQNGRNYPVMRVESGNDGTYFFENVDLSKDKSYTIKAFHREYGVAISDKISFESNAADLFKDGASGKTQQYDLALVREKSVTLKLVDSDGKPIPNKTISLFNNMEPDFSISDLTNENGILEIYNFMHGYYNIRLEDESLKVKNRNIQIPSDEIVITAESKLLKKIVVTEASGKTYTGMLKVSIEMNRNNWPLDVITGEDGSYYIESREEYPIRFATIIFEAPGFAMVRLGPYEKVTDVPKELVVELQPGENYKVKVVDDKTDEPIPYISVSIFSGATKIQSLPTNELGEINFVNLGSSFTVMVKENNYCEYSSLFDGSKLKELQVRLIKGGGIKGHLTLSKEYTLAWISLQPTGVNLQLDAEGNFEFTNLIPGEYTLSVTRNTKDGKNEIEKIPLRIVIENEKIFEINLDDFQKNQTTLDVSVYRDGVLSIELGFLNITDRRGQSVVASQINNGTYKVERILPGEYLLSYNYMGKPLQKTLGIIPNQINAVDIFVPGSSLSVAVKNEEGKPIPKVMITLYAGEKYRQEDSYRGIQVVCDANGVGNFLLMPKAPYYIVVEEDFRFNYQVNVYGPIILEAGQTSRIDYVLPYARKLPKILITDNASKPLPDVGFIFSDEGGNFFQRTLKKEWDLFPYSNKDGYLPENCWPKGNFTLVVGKEGYEYREIPILANFDPNQLLQIKLNKASSIRCNFSQTLPLPISVGILNKNGVLLQKPIPLTSRNKKELTVYFENISMGNVTFSDLATGVYYIGYFWNGSNRMINRQGPFQLGVEENMNVTSTLQVGDY